MKIINHMINSQDKNSILECYNSCLSNPYEKPMIIQNCYKEQLNFRANWLMDLVIEDDLVVINDLPIDDLLPRTPISEVFDYSLKKSYISEYSLLYLSAMLGQIKNYNDEKQGAYIHNIYPIEAKKNEFSNHGYNTELKLHNEVAFDINRPDYIILLCLRSDPKFQAQTLVVRLEECLNELNPVEQELLTLPIFKIYPPFSFENRKPVSQALLVMKNNKISYAGFNFNEGVVTTENHQARKVLHKLYAILRGKSKDIFLKPRQAIIINNRTMLHARTSFAKGESCSRWLQRVYVKEDYYNA